MCGICGVISFKGPFDHTTIKKMNSAFIHRGPDGDGYFYTENVGLGMRRLSIIDLQGGWQPLYSEDKSIVLVLNGEIYNYIELRELLIKKGHLFSTKADGETIVHLYQEFGVNCLQHLRGMFAFALWDKQQKRLFIARDRMGEKPLYLYQDNSSLIFSSELRSLLSSGKIGFSLDPVAIDMFFHYHYVPEPHTPIKGVRKLPAGHYLLIEQGSMKISEHCYWRMEDANPLTGNASKIIREKLEEVARLVIRADVPVGVALSGGIDSSAVAALAMKYYNGNMHSFTVGYEGNPESDERHTARKIASHLNMPFHEIEITEREFVNNFPLMCSLSDDPIADISAFGYYSVSKKAKEEGVPVLLQGQGGDELFWGYPWLRKNYSYIMLKKNLLDQKANIFDYYRLKYKEKYTAPTFKKAIKGILSFPEAFNLYYKHKTENKNIFPFYDYHKGFNWSRNESSNMYGSFMLEAYNDFSPNAPFEIENAWLNPEVTLTKLICSTYLLENGIAQGDRLSMANSVELRLPLIDHQLVETVIGLRKNYNDLKLPPKNWLNNSIKDLLPSWLFDLRKRGFEPPVQSWLHAILKEYGNTLHEGRLFKNGIINKKAAIELANGKSDPMLTFPAYFNALVLEEWLNSIEKNNSL